MKKNKNTDSFSKLKFKKNNITELNDKNLFNLKGGYGNGDGTLTPPTTTSNKCD